MPNRFAISVLSTALIAATPAYAFLGLGMKADLEKGVKLALKDAKSCLGWPVVPSADHVIIFDPNGSWKRLQKLILPYEKAGIVTVSEKSGMETEQQYKNGDKLYYVDDQFVTRAKLKSLHFRKKDMNLIQVVLTEKWKPFYNAKAYAETDSPRPGLCSGRLEVSEIIRWSEPTASNGKTITEVRFRSQRTGASSIYESARKEIVPNPKPVDGVVNLYKTSDGWRPAGPVTYKDADPQ